MGGQEAGRRRPSHKEQQPHRCRWSTTELLVFHDVMLLSLLQANTAPYTRFGNWCLIVGWPSRQEMKKVHKVA